MSEPGRLPTVGDSRHCLACRAPEPAPETLTRCPRCGEAWPTHRGEASGILGRVALGATWAFAALVLTVLGLIRWVGPSWWGVTLLLFLPRWLYLGPIPVLALASARAGRPSDWATQGAIALVVAGPLMGVSLPIRQLARSRLEGTRVRILSFNLGTGRIDALLLIRLIEQERIDLIAFQEGTTPDPTLDAYLSRGWYRDRTRFLASRFPIVSEMAPLIDDSTTEERHSARLNRVRLRLPSGAEFILGSVHMPTLRFGFYRLFGGNVAGMKLHIDWWRHEMGRVIGALSDVRGTPLLVGGDFNMTTDDSTMAALATQFSFGFEEAGWGYGYTRPTTFPWFRIDHILASPEWVFTRCWVGADLGSDHLPLLAEAVLPGPIPGESPRRLVSQAQADSSIECGSPEGICRPARRPRNSVAPARSRRYPLGVDFPCSWMTFDSASGSICP